MKRNGTLFIVIGAALTLVSTLIHVFPPHQTVVTVILGLGEKHVCTVTDVDKETRRTRSGRSTTYVHTVRCPDARVHEVSTGVGERHSRPAASRSVTGDAAA
ncbi:hypothetical protein ABGB14_26620 [Nonomuraea sp. B10E15]|uniref:hypothetical protein n=1 Tax=Nonomuraea sp. B10E15 TaxID=3153560 RepID=UPI00325E3D9C